MNEKSPASVRPARNASETKKRLLDAAEREFGARGFQGARLREIADAASVQPALIHHYFEDKHGLYRAVLDRALLPTSTESWAILSNATDLKELVTAFVGFLVDYHAEHQGLLAIMRHEAVDSSPIWSEVNAERIAPILAACRAFLKNAQEKGELRRDMDPDELMLLVMSMAVHPFSEAKMVATLLPSCAGTAKDLLAKRKRAIVALLLESARAK